MQAARGTSLSDEDGARAPSSGRAPRRRPAVALLLLLATTWYAADQVTKALAVDRLSDGDVTVWEGVLDLTLVRNPGAAFSTGTQYTVALSCFAIVAAVVVAWISRRVGSLVWATALGLLLAGVLGNLTDRLLRDPSPLRGHVVDFLRLPSWPVFNLADIAINVAAGLILLQALPQRPRRRPARRPRPGRSARRLVSEADHRSLVVPDSLEGERVDAAMARLFGVSRSRAADLIGRGLVVLDGPARARATGCCPAPSSR